MKNRNGGGGGCVKKNYNWRRGVLGIWNTGEGVVKKEKNRVQN